MFRLLKRSAIPAVGLLGLAAATPAFAACPSVNKVNNNTIAQSPDISTDFTISTVTNPNDTATYTITTPSNSPTAGIPGLIEYCVYPSQPPGNPQAAQATYVTPAPGNDAWQTDFAVIGRFGFKRPGGNSSNLPFDGSTQTLGTATWDLAHSPAPTAQTIVLHINDPDECSTLYNQPGATTCFVLPTTVKPPPSIVCNGKPACKEAEIVEAITTDPLTVPEFTKLHIEYTYVIVNQPTNNFDMIFYPPTASTQDINSGGGKDYFGCEQVPDPGGAPGKANVFSPYQNTSLTLNMFTSTGNCSQYRFTLTDGLYKPSYPPPATPYFVLHPGDQVSFFVDMNTRCNNNARKYEYTSTSLHFLNSGFTVKWFQKDLSTGQLSPLQSFATDPIGTYVNPIPTDQIQICSK